MEGQISRFMATVSRESKKHKVHAQTIKVQSHCESFFPFMRWNYLKPAWQNFRLTKGFIYDDGNASNSYLYSIQKSMKHNLPLKHWNRAYHSQSFSPLWKHFVSDAQHLLQCKCIVHQGIYFTTLVFYIFPHNSMVNKATQLQIWQSKCIK